MLILRLFSLALATFWSAVDQPYPEQIRSCTKPAIRREWRAFNTHEKAEWIRAVNVRSIATLKLGAHAVLGLQCLSHLPHDPALAPSVDPSISLIPPVNVSSSYYDGIVPSFPLFRDVEVRFHRSGIPAHGPEYSGTLYINPADIQ
jgi:tyrosinase